MNSRSFSSNSRDDDDGNGSRTRLRGEHAAGTSSPDDFYPLSNSRPRSSARCSSSESISEHSWRSPELSFSQGSNRDQSNLQPLNLDDHAEKKFLQGPPLQFLRRSASEQPNKDASSQMDNNFLDKFKLGVNKRQQWREKSGLSFLTEPSDFPPDNKTRPPLDAEEIFKKMNETGLNKKAPFSSMAWEAVLGKKSSAKPF